MESPLIEKGKLPLLLLNVFNGFKNVFLLLPKLNKNEGNKVGFAICLRHYDIPVRA